jgi:cytochrome b involved in lipid metabolism
MSADNEFTFKEVADHSTKKDLYLVVHDKVYDCTSFVDEHPCVSPNHPRQPHPNID